MKRIGKIMNVTSDGSIVVRSSQAYDIGSFIVDRGSARIGRISRVTGPVSSPYIIIAASREFKEHSDRFRGKELFLQEKRDRDREVRRRGPKPEGIRSADPRRGSGSTRGSVKKPRGPPQQGSQRIGTGRVHRVKSVKKRK